MDAKTAIIESLKYNSVALIPSFIGFGIVLAGLYMLIGQPAMEIIDILNQNDIQWIIENDQEVLNRVIERTSFILSPILIIVGYLIHRIGRTSLLFYFTGRSAVEKARKELDKEADN